MSHVRLAVFVFVVLLIVGLVGDPRTRRTDSVFATQADTNRTQFQETPGSASNTPSADQKSEPDQAEHKNGPLTTQGRPALEAALRNIGRWFVVHGPRLLGIILITALIIWAGHTARDRLVDVLTRRLARGGKVEREARAQTLIGVCHNAATVAVVFGAATMFLSELGVNVSVIVGGAAVFGLAVAFGAQNLTRDYFYGFVILLENQYRVGDVVTIGQVSGVVERVTLRITALRGEDGTLHFVPNGQILTVGNKTHGWSRALFEIPIGYREDVDYVMDVLREIGQELRKTPGYELLIVDDPEMLGVDALGDSAVIIKFHMKTQPAKQWKVKREMLRRIKKRFDELNVEIPLPQRTIHYRNDDDTTDLERLRREAGPVGMPPNRNRCQGSI